MTEEKKVKGAADIIILLDVTSGMQYCIDAVNHSVSDFIVSYSSPDANGATPITDWRMKIVGYRDSEADPSDWFVDNPFVSDLGAVRAQLSAANLKASGGGDEPESLLDALMKLAKMDQVSVENPVDPNKWRALSTCARAIIFFTDATFKTTIKIPEATGGTVVDVMSAITQSRIFLTGFCPEWEGYEALAEAESCQIISVTKLVGGAALASFDKSPDEAKTAQMASMAALKAAVADPANFKELLSKLAHNLQKFTDAELS